MQRLQMSQNLPQVLVKYGSQHSFLRCDRRQKTSGRVGLYVKEFLIFTELFTSSSSAVKVFVTNVENHHLTFVLMRKPGMSRTVKLLKSTLRVQGNPVLRL